MRKKEGNGFFNRNKKVINKLPKGKKGVSNLLAIILIILIVLAMIILVWNLVKGLIDQQAEIASIKASMINEDVDINDVDISASQSQINLTIHRGPARLVVANRTVIETRVNVDVISVVDLSGSMGDNAPGECKIDPDYCGGGVWDVTTCENCNGVFVNGECFMNPENSCCIGETCYYGEGCECKNQCEACNGLWKSKLELAQIANRDLINSILENPTNQFGLVAYSTQAIQQYSHSLSKDIDILNEKVDDWTAGGMTCICCGINKAIEYLDNSENFKAMILMSDGVASRTCGGSSAKNDAIDSAEEAYENGIIVYTIGLGESNLDSDTLEEIAEKGHGEYYFADVSALEEIYGKVNQEIITHYKQEEYDHLKIIFYNATDSYEYRIYDLPLPLETKTYPIPEDIIREFELSEKITGINRIEIYQVVLTSDGGQVIGPLLDSWTIS